MNEATRKRGRPRLVVTQEVVERRRLLEQQHNARRANSPDIVSCPGSSTNIASNVNTEGASQQAGSSRRSPVHQILQSGTACHGECVPGTPPYEGSYGGLATESHYVTLASYLKSIAVYVLYRRDVPDLYLSLYILCTVTSVACPCQLSREQPLSGFINRNMDQVPRKRGRPSLTITKVVRERRKLSEQTHDANRNSCHDVMGRVKNIGTLEKGLMVLKKWMSSSRITGMKTLW